MIIYNSDRADVRVISKRKNDINGNPAFNVIVIIKEAGTRECVRFCKSESYRGYTSFGQVGYYLTNGRIYQDAKISYHFTPSGSFILDSVETK